MNTLYVRCQTKDCILDIVAARAGIRINKVNSEIESLKNNIKELTTITPLPSIQRLMIKKENPSALTKQETVS